MPVTIKKQEDTIVQYFLACNSSESIDVLERMNRIGVFTYQPDSNRVISTPIKRKDLSNVQKEYLKDFSVLEMSTDTTSLIEFDVTDNINNGALNDWLLRGKISFEYIKKENETSLRFYPKNEIERSDILKKAEQLLISEKKD